MDIRSMFSKLISKGSVIIRAVIVIFFIMLIPHLVGYWPEGKYRDSAIEELVESGQAEVYELGSKIHIDHDVLTIDRLVISSEHIYLIYTIKKAESGWTFPDSSLKLVDRDGKELFGKGGGSSGKYRGEMGVQIFNKAEGDTDPKEGLTLQYEWYDREAKLKLLPGGPEEVTAHESNR